MVRRLAFLLLLCVCVATAVAYVDSARLDLTEGEGSGSDAWADRADGRLLLASGLAGVAAFWTWGWPPGGRRSVGDRTTARADP